MSVVAALNAHVAEGRRLAGIIESVARDVALLVGLSLKAGNGASLRYRGYERVEMDDFYRKYKKLPYSFMEARYDDYDDLIPASGERLL